MLIHDEEHLLRPCKRINPQIAPAGLRGNLLTIPLTIPEFGPPGRTENAELYFYKFYVFFNTGTPLHLTKI